MTSRCVAFQLDLPFGIHSPRLSDRLRKLSCIREWYPVVVYQTFDATEIEDLIQGGLDDFQAL